MKYTKKQFEELEKEIEEQKEIKDDYIKRYLFWYNLSFYIITIGLGVGIAFLIIWYFNIQPMPNYHIYKNECHNETQYLEDNAKIYLFQKGYEQNTSYRIDITPTYIKDFDLGRKIVTEVCNKNEVDEIIYKYTPTTYLSFCLSKGKDFDRCILETNKITEMYSDWNDTNITIKKSDITKEWLNKNCEFVIPKECPTLDKCKTYYKCVKYEVYIQ